MIAEEVDPAVLGGMSVRQARVRFMEAVDPGPLGEVEGVSLLSQSNGISATLQVEGEMDGLIKALAAFPVRDFATERRSLEEVFLAYYEGDGEERA